MISVAVDIGGTFTDVVVLQDGRILAFAKVPSTPRHPAGCIVEGAITALSQAGLRPEQVDRFVHGTTVATNAVLERLVVMSLSGVDPQTGRRFIASELGAGGMGARPGMDGVDAIETDATNCMNLPAESVEVDFPIRINYSRLRTDSGGAGQWRGGLGFAKSFEAVDTELQISYRGERHFTSPWGVAGGADGGRARAQIRRADGRIETVGSKQIVLLQPGERLEIETAGGAGYGDPRERPRDKVAEDLRDHKISPEAAEEQYGPA